MNEMKTIKNPKQIQEAFGIYKNMFEELQKHFGNIIEVQFNQIPNYINKYDETADNSWAVFKTDKDYCIVFFTGLYYKSEYTFDAYVIPCEKVDITEEFPVTNLQEGEYLEMVEDEVGIYLDDVMEKYDYNSGDVEELVDNLRRSLGIYSFRGGFVDINKLTEEEQKNN